MASGTSCSATALASIIACTLVVGAWSPTAQAGYKDGMDALAARDFQRARNEFEQDRANPKALMELSRMARLALGEPRNETRSVNLIKEAADLGLDEAKLEYAYALGNGTGTAKDPAAALGLLQGMANAGHVEGMVTLARAKGYGWWDQPKDPAGFVELAQRAMKLGDNTGQMLYAFALLDGNGVAKDEPRAAELLREKAERGHLESQPEYARLLTFGIGTPKDEAAGTAMYRKAAERDNRVAQYALGLAYLLGRGVSKDERAAVRWIDASARQGWTWAQVDLADSYRLGRGVPVLRAEAYYWYSVAARGSSASAVERANAQRTLLARDLSPAQIERQTTRAAAFVAQSGFKPRSVPLAPPSHDDRIDLGGTSFRVPAPRGYLNGWQTVEWMQQAYPNDPELRPLLMVLYAQEDMDRLKLGLSNRLRGIEVARHTTDDAVRVTPQLFGEIKAQLRTQFDAAIAAGRFRSEGVSRDDDHVLSVIRGGTTDPARLDALSYLLLKDKVIVLTFTGFQHDQKEQLTELVRSTTDDLLSANRPGFFSR